VTWPKAVLFALMASWILVPLTIDDSFVLDGIPMVIAGDLLLSDPKIIYPTGDRIAELHPDFVAHGCADPDINSTCRPTAGFLSPPPSYPLVVAISALPGATPMRVWMLLSVAPLVLSMYLLARRPYFEEHPWWLVGAAAALTPFIVWVADLGQSSGLLLLALVAGTGTSRTQRLVAGVALGTVTALKLTPIVVVVAAFVLGKRLVATSATATLAGLALLGTLIHSDGWSAFLHTSAGLSREAPLTGGNGSFASLFAMELVPTIIGGGIAVTAVAVAWRRDRRLAWLVLWVSTLLVTPFLWLHYLVVLVGVLLLRAEDTRVDLFAVFAIAAAAIVGAMTWLGPEDLAVVFTPLTLATLGVLLAQRSRVIPPVGPVEINDPADA